MLNIALLWVRVFSLTVFSHSFFFLNDTAPTEISPLSLHDALPIYVQRDVAQPRFRSCPPQRRQGRRRPFHPDDDPLLCGLSHDRLQNILILRTLSPRPPHVDRKSTRLNSSHSQISYAVFCLKKKKR